MERSTAKTACRAAATSSLGVKKELPRPAHQARLELENTPLTGTGFARKERCAGPRLGVGLSVACAGLCCGPCER